VEKAHYSAMVRDTGARKDAGVSKLQLSRLLGVDRKTLAIYEVAPERIGTLRRAAFALAYGALRLAVDACVLARMIIRRGR
jgi:hypothetical protein